LKVVHICNLPLPPGHPDATRLRRHSGRWALNLAMAQHAHTDLRPECVVVTPGASSVHVEEVDGIQVHYVPAARRGRASTLFVHEVLATRRYIRHLSPEVVHAHGSEDSNLLIALATGLPVVFSAQALFFQMRKRERFPLICRQRVTGLLEDLALRRTRFAVGKSEYVSDGLKSRYPNIRVELIPNTFDVRLLDVPLDRKKRNAVAFVGTINPRKGADLIASALRRVSS